MERGPSPDEAFVHLHARSWYSFLRGASSPKALAERARALGQPALAITDWMTVAGAVQFELATRAVGIKPVFGAEVVLEGAPMVFLCASRAGYSTLCRLLTVANANRERPSLPLLALAEDNEGLFLLTGGRDGRLRQLLESGQNTSALEWVRSLSALMPGRTFVELSMHQRPGEHRLMGRLSNLAKVAGLSAVATNDVRHAARDDFAVHDLLACVRLGITVDDEHEERPVNDGAHLKSGLEMARLVFDPVARANTLAIAQECRLSLLAEHVSPPGAVVPHCETANAYLEGLCRAGLKVRYGRERHKRALEQLEKELGVVGGLDLAEFFLVVREVVEFARVQGIRAAGRGSAANSIIAFALGITQVDPLEHNLVFERFLHVYRQGTPDIDIDFASHRRDEVVRWVEERFEGHAAMTANVNTYGIRGAVKDAAKALGWPHAVANEMTRNLPHYDRPGRAAEHRAALEAVVGPSALLDALVKVVSRLDGCPRELGVHSGGMLLTRRPITDFTSVQTSSGGIRQAVFDKEDIERLGLVKLDILGLRALSVIEEALVLHERTTGERLDVDGLPLDDSETFALVLSGETLGLFQIESPGQKATLAKHQPSSFRDLVAQVALLRPGPIQGNAVHPYIRRSRGLEAVTYPHPSLEPALRDTFGVILYQEQVLQAASAFAGMGLAEADEFRRLTSKFRSRNEMEALRERFVRSAIKTHQDVSSELANTVFDSVSAFSGYGFPRSHAVAFARTAYITAYLKAHQPAAYFAALMQHEPGMYPMQSFVEEARRCGVPTLPPRLEASALGFSLERLTGRLAIRMPLESVTGVSANDASSLLLEDAVQPFEDLEDLYRRSRVNRDVLLTLAQAGALERFGARREVVWKLGVLEGQLGPPGGGATPLIEAPVPNLDDLPPLETLTGLETAAWDHRTARATTGPHPMALLRGTLERVGVTPIVRLVAGEAKVAGLVTARQQPGSAKGIIFIELEDETSRVQCIVYPTVWAVLHPKLTQSALLLGGRVQRLGNWRGLVVAQAWSLEAIGGRAGLPRA